MAKTIKELSEQISKLNGTILAFQTKIGADIATIKKEVNNISTEIAGIKQIAVSAKKLALLNEQKIATLTSQVTQLSDRNRRANLILTSISEEVTSNKLEQTLVEWMQSNQVEVQPEEIERAHRLQRNGRGGAPRDVIIKFAREKTQQQVFKSLKRRKDLSFRGKKVWVRQDFCQETLRKKSQMRPFAQKLYANNVKFSWGYPASIIIFQEGKRLMARNTTEAKDLLQKLGINTEDMEEEEMPEEEEQEPDEQEDTGEGTSDRGEKRPRSASS